MTSEEFIKYTLDKYPRYTHLPNKQAIYNAGISAARRNEPHILKTLEPIESRQDDDEEIGRSFIGMNGSWGIDITNTPNWLRDAYNNSLTGAIEMAATGKRPYDLDVDASGRRIIFYSRIWYAS